jgi:Putative zinc-finger
MTCKECQSVLETYFDSELSPEAATPVTAHIAVCDRCAESYRRLEFEHDFYLRHQRAPAVSPAFWSEVFEETGRARGRLASLREHLVRAREAISEVRLGPLPIAALLILAIGLTAGVMSFLNAPKLQPALPPHIAERTPQKNPGKDTTESTLPVDDKSRDSVQSRGESRKSQVSEKKRSRPIDQVSVALRNRQRPDVLVRDAERKYLTAISLLTRDAERRRSSLDPAVLAQFDQALAAVDRTIAGTRIAVRAHPDDPVAVQYMLAAYARKVDVLRQMITD